jgi:hypothetical protein
MAKLGVTIRRAAAFVRLDVRLERIVACPQQPTNGRLGYRMPLRLQRGVQMADALGGPLPQAHRITLRIQERFQVGDQGGVLRAQALPAPAAPTCPIARHVRSPSCDLRDPLANRVTRGLRVSCHRADTTASDLLGFHGKIQPPLPFIECRA